MSLSIVVLCCVVLCCVVLCCVVLCCVFVWAISLQYTKYTLTLHLIFFTDNTIFPQALARRFIVRNLGAKQWRKKLHKKKKVQPTQLNRYLANIDYYSRSKKRKPAYLEDGYSTWCAVRIQAWWRMVPKRRHHIYRIK